MKFILIAVIIGVIYLLCELVNVASQPKKLNYPKSQALSREMDELIRGGHEYDS